MLDCGHCNAPHTIESLSASVQLKAGVGFREVRRWQTRLTFQRLQQFNQDFAVPVLLGIAAEEQPGTPLYHMLSTGFMPQLPRAPRAPPRPTATALSMSSARVDFERPFDHGDGPILGWVCGS